MKSPIIFAVIIVVLAIVSGPFIYFDSLAEDMPDSSVAYGKLQGAGSVDPLAWFQLARDARSAGDLKVARKALDKAVEYGLPSVRQGIEMTRIQIAGGDSAAAIAALQQLSDAGFTSVGVLTQDPVINSLAGNPSYDELVSNMSVMAYPCAHQASFQDFDFWVGEWDVHLANGVFIACWPFLCTQMARLDMNSHE